MTLTTCPRWDSNPRSQQVRGLAHAHVRACVCVCVCVCVREREKSQFRKTDSNSTGNCRNIWLYQSLIHHTACHYMTMFKETFSPLQLEINAHLILKKLGVCHYFVCSWQYIYIYIYIYIYVTPGNLPAYCVSPVHLQIQTVNINVTLNKSLEQKCHFFSKILGSISL